MRFLFLLFVISFANLLASPLQLQENLFLEKNGDLRLKIGKENTVQLQEGNSSYFLQIHLKHYASIRNEIWLNVASIEKIEIMGPLDPLFIKQKKKRVRKKFILGNIKAKEEPAFPALLPKLTTNTKLVFLTMANSIHIMVFNAQGQLMRTLTFVPLH